MFAVFFGPNCSGLKGHEKEKKKTDAESARMARGGQDLNTRGLQRKGARAMDAKDQTQGERQVDDLLVKPLMRRGLAKPSTLNKEEFAEMLLGIRAKLAYMDPDKLMALEEVVAAKPGGKDRDRFPIANFIFERALDIQPPPDDASPFIRAVFAHGVGADAIAQGWAPELLKYVRHNRGKWPGGFVQSQLIEEAGDSVRRLTRIEERMARGEEVDGADAEFRTRRLAVMEKCRHIRALGQEGQG